MLEADQWDRVLANVKGTIVRGSERVSATRLLDLLDVGPDPAIRQKVGKRPKNLNSPSVPGGFPELRTRHSIGRLLTACAVDCNSYGGGPVRHRPLI